MLHLSPLKWFLPLIFLLPFKGSAAPVYLTFEGTVTFNINAPDYFVGKTAEFVFMYDLDQDGYYIINGNTEYLSDDENYDYFYAEYVGGDAVPIDQPSYPSNPTQSFIHHVGDRYRPLPGTVLTVSNFDPSGSDEIMVAGNQNGDISNWAVGQSFDVNQRLGGAPTAWMGASTILTSISSTNPIESIPEPGSTTTMIAGLVLLFGVWKRNQITRT